MPGYCAILSPAKRMAFDGPSPSIETTRPRFNAKRNQLRDYMRSKTARQLTTLQSISPTLARENVERWSSMDTRANPRGAAALCFQGDVYQGLDAATLNATAQRWLQANVRLLSGLYGVLRPMDVLQPYRLEMGTKLNPLSPSGLHEFWKDTVTKALRSDFKGADMLVNLASDEYAAAIDTSALGMPVINIRFLQEVDGKDRFMSFYAKRSRGEFARWMAQHRPKSIASLSTFDAEGYTLRDSSDDMLTFSRPKPAPLSERKRA